MANCASSAFTSAGTTIAISDTLPSANNQAGYEALTFVDIGEVTDLGEFGRVYNLVTHNPLGDRRTIKRKGSYNDGSITLSMARVPTDPGQAILVDAVDDDASYAVKVTLQNGTVFYTTVQVMSYTTNVGSVDQITSASVTLEIDCDILQVDPVSVPNAPAGLSATAGDTEVVLNWTAATGDPTGHRVYFGTVNNFASAAQFGSDLGAAAATATVTGLTNGTMYYFWITAFNVGGSSVPSIGVAATPAA